ncbi:hypothetical protein MKW98_005379 [Papaver atlanticum]|uniref:Water stress and hypersensitive response domain-containing protein n=1 Tax=Papaver atlanticum TaxID=357466 RepID=A0AAD4RX83_9MAGN|nr:hypothetical protein MKW98_005379 [Papaver atlanticum]
MGEELTVEKGGRWSWNSVAIIGALTATATAAITIAKPKDPIFHLMSINLTSFKFNLPLLDAELILTVHVTNPNIVPINYSTSTMKIFYDGSLLGSAQIEAGSQGAKSCELLKLPGRLNGVELAHHAAKFLSDVAKREMILDAVVDIEGMAKVLWWGHKFKVHVDSHITVDPVFLDVIDQQNKSELNLFMMHDIRNKLMDESNQSGQEEQEEYDTDDDEGFEKIE